MMHYSNFSPSAEPDQFARRGMRIRDMPTLLAVLAVRQAILPTAKAMRQGDGPVGKDAASRMVRLFAERERGTGGAAGAFHTEVAHYLVGTEEGEEGVYRGA